MGGRLKGGGKSTGKNNHNEDPDYLSSCSDTNDLDEANDIGKEHHALKK